MSHSPGIQKSYPWIDSLRFFAALIVVISHARNAVFVEYGLLPDSERTLFVSIAYAVTRISNEAVIMFFILSGFLVGGRATSKIIDGQFNAASYAIDRFSRIMVPLFPALVFTAIVIVFKGESLDLIGMIGNLLSLQGVFFESFGGNEPLWSLSYEVWFYILVFLIGIVASKGKLGMIPLIFLVITFVIFCYLLPSYLFCWLVGAMVYFMPPPRYFKLALFVSVILMVIGIVAIQLSSGSRALADSTILYYLPPIEVSRIFLSMGMALFVRLVILIEHKNSFFRSFDDVCGKLAKASYSLYLTHFPLIHLFLLMGLEPASEVNGITIMTFLAVLIACVLFSGVFYFLFEKHTVPVRDHLKQYFQQKQVIQETARRANA